MSLLKRAIVSMAKTDAPPVWTLEQGLTLVRAIQPLTRMFGYHVTLGGSVLNDGASEKDLDLFFLPLNNGGPWRPDDLRKWIEAMFAGKIEPFERTVAGYSVGTSSHTEGSVTYDGKRVDVFIMKGLK